MTQWTAEQWAKAQLANLDAMAGLTNKAAEGFESVIELNLHAMKTTLEQTRKGVTKAMTAQTPQDVFELQMELFQPAVDNVLAYRHQLHDILAATRTHFEKVLEVQYATSKSQLEGFLESGVSNSPSGSSTPLTAWQDVIKATTALYESMQSTAKQAAKVAESSFNTTAEAAAKAMRRHATQASVVAAK